MIRHSLITPARSLKGPHHLSLTDGPWPLHPYPPESPLPISRLQWRCPRFASPSSHRKKGQSEERKAFECRGKCKTCPGQVVSAGARESRREKSTGRGRPRGEKATRDLNDLISSVEGPMNRLDVVQRKYEELLSDMKKLERDHVKSKKRADQLQKDSEKAKTEHNKTATMKDKLEKLCRELTKENKKLKDENKKLDENEKQAREMMNEKLDQMLYDVQDAMNSKTTTHAENLHLELDDLYVFPSHHITLKLPLSLADLIIDSKLGAKSCLTRPISAKPISRPFFATRMPK